jgi:hypothetical protein
MDGISHILEHGSVFKKSSEKKDDGKIKTKAKRTSYVKGAHGSGSAKMKAEYKRKRQNRHKKG